MQVKTFSPTAAKFARLQEFAIVCQTGSIAEIETAFDSLKADKLFQSKGWQARMTAFKPAIAGDVVATIFAQGNSKLPFFAFSTLPGVTCPGAGDCLQWCYSFRAWQYPAAFFRQCQNAIFMRFYPQNIANAMSELVAKNPEGFDFRLYVDGDFSSSSDVEFWFDLLNQYPQVRAYGYSKSFELLVNYTGIIPDNYLLNISGGSNASTELIQQSKELTFTRGEFIAVSIGRKVRGAEYGTVAINRATMQAAGQKVFPCPGKCGSCTGKGHACGLPQMKGKVIAIAIH